MMQAQKVLEDYRIGREARYPQSSLPEGATDLVETVRVIAKCESCVV
jgi:hypothetical protein